MKIDTARKSREVHQIEVDGVLYEYVTHQVIAEEGDAPGFHAHIKFDAADINQFFDEEDFNALLKDLPTWVREHQKFLEEKEE